MKCIQSQSLHNAISWNMFTLLLEWNCLPYLIEFCVCVLCFSTLFHRMPYLHQTPDQNSHGTNKSIYPNGVVREKSSIYPLNELVNFMLFHETKFIPSIWMIEKGDGHTEKQISKTKKKKQQKASRRVCELVWYSGLWYYWRYKNKHSMKIDEPIWKETLFFTCAIAIVKL